MTFRDILRTFAAAGLAVALATSPADAANRKRRGLGEPESRCAAAHAMAKKALKAKAAEGFTVLPHPSGRVAISGRDATGQYTRTVVLRAGGSYTQLLDSQGAVLETFADGVPVAQIL